MTLAALLTVLAVHNLIGNERWYVPVNLATTAAVASLSGLSLDQLGLTTTGWRIALLAGGAAAMVVVVVAALPSTRLLFLDQRMAGVDSWGTAWRALVRIPLGTVVLEEVAFRGVLPVLTAPWLAAALFGLWHIRPTVKTLATNRLPPALVAVAVPATAVAGYGFWLLRQATGGLLAPAAVHAAITSTATVASSCAHRGRRARRHGPNAKGSTVARRG